MRLLSGELCVLRIARASLARAKRLIETGGFEMSWQLVIALTQPHLQRRNLSQQSAC
jgi:hypothetical protein